MTCAHIVNVALKKTPGVESVDVSLNKGLATVKLKPGNTASVPPFWQLLHEKGYSPKTTTVSARGELVGKPGQLQFKISGTKDVLSVAPDSRNPGAYNSAAQHVGQTVVVRGVMVPGKDLRALAPLQIEEVK